MEKFFFLCFFLFSTIQPWLKMDRRNFPIENHQFHIRTTKRSYIAHITYTQIEPRLIRYFVIQWYATAAAKCSVDYFNLFVVVLLVFFSTFALHFAPLIILSAQESLVWLSEIGFAFRECSHVCQCIKTSMKITFSRRSVSVSCFFLRILIDFVCIHNEKHNETVATRLKQSTNTRLHFNSFFYYIFCFFFSISLHTSFGAFFFSSYCHSFTALLSNRTFDGRHRKVFCWVPRVIYNFLNNKIQQHHN